MSEILSREDAVRAFLDGEELELNYKPNKGAEGGWGRLVNKDAFWDIIARQSSDFRIAVPKAAFKEDEFAYLVSYEDAKDGRRYAGAYSYHRSAMFVKVTRTKGYTIDDQEGWTYDVVDSEETPQIVHERDLRKASEVAPILIDE